MGWLVMQPLFHVLRPWTGFYFKTSGVYTSKWSAGIEKGALNCGIEGIAVDNATDLPLE
jgi:hypothetical protein